MFNKRVENKTGTRREKERERMVDEREKKRCAKNKKERERKAQQREEWKTQKRIQLVFNTHFSSTYLYLYIYFYLELAKRCRLLYL